MYPNPELTPGVTLNVAEADICVVGYTKKVRSVSNAEKKQVFREYGIPWENRSQYEVDHFVSLELAGSNDIKNLWPEPYLPKPGARQKDVVETFLHKEICEGRITLKQAQDQIMNDWYQVYIELKGGIHQ